MGGFFTFVIILFLLFWLIGRFGPILLAWWIKRNIGKFSGNRGNYPANENYKEGETIINNNIRKESKIVDKNIGEYVEFEETKEETKEV
jgi:hypothetical protein